MASSSNIEISSAQVYDDLTHDNHEDEEVNVFAISYQSFLASTHIFNN